MDSVACVGQAWPGVARSGQAWPGVAASVRGRKYAMGVPWACHSHYL